VYYGAPATTGRAVAQAPKVFISYSWSSPQHRQWVLDLATQLRENAVDVTIDKWDLKEGHDATAFMEQMVKRIAPLRRL